MAKKLGRSVPRRVLVNSNLTAVGALFISVATQRGLFLLRDQDTYSNTWGLVGGTVEFGETLYGGLVREINEELGFEPPIKKVIPLEYFNSPDGHFSYHTFVILTNSEFIPILSSEHKGYAWCDLTNTPKPLHPGLYNSFSSNVVKDKLKTIKQILEITK